MKKGKLVLVMALVAVLVFALAACGKQDAGKGGSAAKYEGDVAETDLLSRIKVKYPVAFKLDEKLSSDVLIYLKKENEDWEVNVSCIEYGASYTPYKEFAQVEKDNRTVYGDKVEKIKVGDKEALKVDAGAGINIIIPGDDKYYIEFSCRVQINKTADYKTAFNTPEVQYILENITAK